MLTEEEENVTISSHSEDTRSSGTVLFCVEHQGSCTQNSPLCASCFLDELTDGIGWRMGIWCKVMLAKVLKMFGSSLRSRLEKGHQAKSYLHNQMEWYENAARRHS